MTEASSVLRKVDDHLSYYFSDSKEHFLGEGRFAYVFLGVWKNPSADLLTGGKVNVRDLAVKRIQKVPSMHTHTSVEKEVKLMLHVKEHPNILLLYYIRGFKFLVGFI